MLQANSNPSAVSLSPGHGDDGDGDAEHAGVRALVARVADLQSEARELRGRIRELEALADTDPLLGIPNRRAFTRELTRMLAYARRHGGGLSLVYLDLDSFKSINDTLGHMAGDAALAHAARSLQSQTRASDLLGRLGGDEFAVAMPLADARQACARGEALVAGLAADPLSWEGRRIVVRASFGVAAADVTEDAEALLAAADAQLIAAKRDRRVRTAPGAA